MIRYVRRRTAVIRKGTINITICRAACEEAMRRRWIAVKRKANVP